MSSSVKKPRVLFFGPQSDPRAVRWWAEGGMLRYEDSRTDAYGVISIKEFLLRLQAISELLSRGRRSENEGFLHPEEVERQMRFIEDAVDLVKLAKEQGDPDDPNVLRDKDARKPLSLILPGMSK
jgi:hypothetical protein